MHRLIYYLFVVFFKLMKFFLIQHIFEEVLESSIYRF